METIENYFLRTTDTPECCELVNNILCGVTGTAAQRAAIIRIIRQCDLTTKDEMTFTQQIQNRWSGLNRRNSIGNELANTCYNLGMNLLARSRKEANFRDPVKEAEELAARTTT
jgi:hypothetical protein